MIVEQALEFLLGRRSLPGAGEGLHHGDGLLITHHNFRAGPPPTRTPPGLHRKEASTNQQERNYRFLEEGNQPFAPRHQDQEGLYQMGLV